jgi:hypothetical protein
MNAHFVLNHAYSENCISNLDLLVFILHKILSAQKMPQMARVQMVCHR